MKTRMDAILTMSSSCSELDNVIRSVWAGQQAEIERAQDEFHLEDEARIQKNRKPLQDQIDINQARLTTIDSEFRSLDQILDDVRRQRDTPQARLVALETDVDESR